MKKGMSIIETTLYVLLMLVVLTLMIIAGGMQLTTSSIENSVKISSPAGSLEINNNIEGNESFVSAENDKFWSFVGSLNIQNIAFIIIFAALAIIILKNPLIHSLGKLKHCIRIHEKNKNKRR